MYQLSLKILKTQQVIPGPKFDTMEELNAHTTKHELQQNFGKLERIKNKAESTEEEILEAVETIPAVMIFVDATLESVDELGNITPATDAYSYEYEPEKIRLPKTYEIIITDISAEVAAAAAKILDHANAIDYLHKLKKTDMTDLDVVKNVIMKMLKVLELD